MSNQTILQPVHPADDEPLDDQPIQSAVIHVQSIYPTDGKPLHDQPAHPVYGEPLHNQPVVTHLPDPPKKDQEQTRRSRRVCREDSTAWIICAMDALTNLLKYCFVNCNFVNI